MAVKPAKNRPHIIPPLRSSHSSPLRPWREAFQRFHARLPANKLLYFSPGLFLALHVSAFINSLIYRMERRDVRDFDTPGSHPGLPICRRYAVFWLPGKLTFSHFPIPLFLLASGFQLLAHFPICSHSHLPVISSSKPSALCP